MLIGLTGTLGSGKDTAYQLICEHPTSEFQRRAFADKLKVSAARALGFTGNTEECVEFCNDLKNNGDIDIWRNSPSPICITGREYLQWYGTEAHRQVFGDDFWIDAILPKDRNLGVRQNIIVTDVRFSNEAERIKYCGGVVWEICRDTGANNAHVSEQRLPDHLIDRSIENNGTIQEFKEKLITAVDGWTPIIRIPRHVRIPHHE